MDASQSRQHMRRALDLAWSVAGGVFPRPPVGAALVSADGEAIGEGAAQARPGDHAEVAALKGAGERARGATLFCTLEPHSFQGVAPSCADAIIASGVANVVVCGLDPNPKQQGRGLEVLRAAGVSVRFADPEHQRENHQLIEGFRKHIAAGVPFVTAKIAMSLDGKIATKTGDSQWITSENARQRGHALRARADAVMTGVNTVLKDDPRLTARVKDAPPQASRPTRIILDRRGRLPASARLLAEPQPVLWFTSDGELENDLSAPNLERVAVATDGDFLDLNMVMTELGKRGFTWILVEAGQTLLTSLRRADLIDKFECFIAPVVIGGRNAPAPIGGDGVGRMSEALKLVNVQCCQIDDNLQLSGYAKSDDFRAYV